MKRIVPIIVTDDEVTDLFVEEYYVSPDGGREDCLGSGMVPVPSDDQLTRDIECIVRWILGDFPLDQNIAHWDDAAEAASTRLRTAFHLDEEGE